MTKLEKNLEQRLNFGENENPEMEKNGETSSPDKQGNNFFNKKPNFSHTFSNFIPPSERVTGKPNFIRFQHLNIFNTYDVDHLKDQILKLKIENNKKAKEIINLKIELGKLEEDNRKNIKMMEKILTETGKSSIEIINSIINKNINCNENINIILSDNNTELNISPNNLYRLSETYIISYLKKQIFQLKQNLQIKEEEIDNYKTNSRVVNFNKMEYNYSNAFNEFSNMKKDYDKLKFLHEENLKNLKVVSEERDYSKAMMFKFKTQSEEAKNKIKVLEEENKSLNEVKRLNEDKIFYLNKNFNGKKSLLKEKENEIQSNYKNENKIQDLNSENKKLKEDIKKNKDNLKNAEGNFKKAMDDLQNRINRLVENISSLEKENSSLKNENASKKEENEKIKFQKLKNQELENNLLAANQKLFSLLNENENLKNSIIILERNVEELNTKFGEEKLKNENIAKNQNILENKISENKINLPVNLQNKEKEINWPVNPEKTEPEMNLPVTHENKEPQINLPINPEKTEQQINSPVISKHKEQEINLLVNPENKEQELNSPVNPETKEQEINLPAYLENKAIISPVNPENKEHEINLHVNPETKEHEINLPVHLENKEHAINSPVNPENKEHEIIFHINPENKEQEINLHLENEEKIDENNFNSSDEDSEGSENLNYYANKNLHTKDSEKKQKSSLFKTATEIHEGKNEADDNDSTPIANIIPDGENQSKQITMKSLKTSQNKINDVLILPIQKSSLNKLNSTGYLIQVSESEPQVIVPYQHYYVKNSNAEITRKKKSNSLLVTQRPIKRAPTIDREITARMSQNINFNDLLEDPTLKHLINIK